MEGKWLIHFLKSVRIIQAAGGTEIKTAVKWQIAADNTNKCQTA